MRHSPPWFAPCQNSSSGCDNAVPGRAAAPSWRRSCTSRAAINVLDVEGSKTSMPKRCAPAYAGAHRFGVEVFDPSTSNTLMAALLVHDLRHGAAAAQPVTALAHPLELFWQGANHGGLWRNPFEPRSVLGLAVALGMLQRGA